MQGSDSSTFICETMNEGAKLEREFKIFSHGQFPSSVRFLWVRQILAFQFLAWDLSFALFKVLVMVVSCRNEALSGLSVHLRKGRGFSRWSSFCSLFSMTTKGFVCLLVIFFTVIVATGMYYSQFTLWNAEKGSFESRETRSCSIVYPQNEDRCSNIDRMYCGHWSQTNLICLEEEQRSLGWLNYPCWSQRRNINPQTCKPFNQWSWILFVYCEELIRWRYQIRWTGHFRWVVEHPG